MVTTQIETNALMALLENQALIIEQIKVTLDSLEANEKTLRRYVNDRV